MSAFTDPRVARIVLYAWVGEDEFHAGEFGLKQGCCAAGCIALVSITAAKLRSPDLVAQLQTQVQTYGKPIRLARFVFDGIEDELL